MNVNFVPMIYVLITFRNIHKKTQLFRFMVAGTQLSVCLTADLKAICVHDLLKIVANSVSNVQIGFNFS